MQLGISLCLCSAISVHSKNEYLNEEKLRAISANSVVSLPSFCLRLHGRERNKICGSSRKEDEKRRRRKKEEEEEVVVVVGRVNLEQGRGGRKRRRKGWNFFHTMAPSLVFAGAEEQEQTKFDLRRGITEDFQR